jgi:hypothetical protein
MIRPRTTVALLALMGGASAFTTSFSNARPAAFTRATSKLQMALDYNDPVVAEELNQVQILSYDEMEEQLNESGIPVPAAMNEFDVRLMLVEVRLRKAGKMNGGTPKAKKTTFSSKFEEYMQNADMFRELVEEMKGRGDHNAVNVCAEYVNDPKMANKRYGESYATLIRQISRAITMPKQVKSTKIQFSGFPANMGEAGCKVTLEALGPIVSFDCVASEDFPVLMGTVEFEDMATAQKAVDQYNGMDMGMGTQLELGSV